MSPNPPQYETLINVQAMCSCSSINAKLLLHFPLLIFSQLLALPPSAKNSAQLLAILNAQLLAISLSHSRTTDDNESTMPPQSDFIMKIQALCSGNKLLVSFLKPSSRRGSYSSSNLIISISSPVCKNKHQWDRYLAGGNYHICWIK